MASFAREMAYDCISSGMSTFLMVIEMSPGLGGAKGPKGRSDWDLERPEVGSANG